MALFNVYLEDFEIKGENKVIAEAAISILKKAILAPITAIIQNSGESADKIIEKLKEHKTSEKNLEKNLWFGFNAISNKLEDLKEAGVIDPLKVTKVAFTNAVSVASNYLVIGAAIVDLPEKKEKESMPEMPEEY